MIRKWRNQKEFPFKNPVGGLEIGKYKLESKSGFVFRTKTLLLQHRHKINYMKKLQYSGLSTETYLSAIAIFALPITVYWP